MEENVKEFLESGLLEEYMMGLTSDADTQKVEQYIQQFPEVKKVYNQLQDDVELFAQKYRSSMPPELKEKIMKKVEDKPNSSAWNKWSSMAAGVALVFLTSTLFLFYQSKDLQQENQQLRSDFAALQKSCEAQGAAFASLEQEHAILSHHLTQKISLKGSGLGEGIAATAYWNKKAEASFMKYQNMPQAPDAHCYQLWADVDGKMVDMGVLPKSNDGLMTLPFKVDATSLNITVEPTGGSDHPTVSRLVASVGI